MIAFVNETLLQTKVIEKWRGCEMVSACHDHCVICGNLIWIASIDVLFPGGFCIFYVHQENKKRAMGKGVQFFSR